LAIVLYQSGEEVKAGDQIKYAGEPGHVELVAEEGDLETDWYFQEFGGGCMLILPSFGRLFVSHPDQDTDLEFISRGDAT
jgi:hypothetical protein